jgi:hypothetical protein
LWVRLLGDGHGETVERGRHSGYLPDMAGKRGATNGGWWLARSGWVPKYRSLSPSLLFGLVVFGLLLVIFFGVFCFMGHCVIREDSQVTSQISVVPRFLLPILNCRLRDFMYLK